MKLLTKYISKYFLSFSAFILILAFLNIIAFLGTFYSTISKDYGNASPRNILKDTMENSSMDGITDEMRERLHNLGIWAMFLNSDGDCIWTVDLPPKIPTKFTVQEVAVFSKGYLEDYPVFVWDDEDGLLVLGYPKGSYTKITSNYYSVDILKSIPFYFVGILIFDLLLVFTAYYISKMKIVKETEPLVYAIKILSEGKPVTLSGKGELSDIIESLNKASQILSKQNEARANWISGVSHDIRTPLSMIMGYAARIAEDDSTSHSVREQAQIIQRQSVKIKELVQDLNLVSMLEYQMQPLNKEPVRLSKLLRSYVAELLNAGIPESYSVEIEVAPNAEMSMLDCDARLISRAVNNLVQNSISHNPQGCQIHLSLECSDTTIALTVADDGVGLSHEKLKELKERPHYLESTDERFDLRHGFGLVLVRQIVESHNGRMEIESQPKLGCKTVLYFKK